MKKILYIVITIISLSFTSCVKMTDNVQKVDLPIDVVTKRDSAKFDTLLVIKGEEKTFQFTTKNEYVGAYDNKIADKESDGSEGLIVFLLTFIFIFGLFSVFD